MSLLFCDSFDHYATAQLPLKYALGQTPTIGAYGRNGTNGLHLDHEAMTVHRGFPANPAVLIAGVNLRQLSSCSLAPPFFVFTLNGVEQIGLHADPATGLVWVYRNGTPIGASTCRLIPTVDVYLELKVAFALGATGSITLRANGVVVLALVNVQTAVTSAYANGVMLRGFQSGGSNFDDFYVCDTAGAVNNDFLGDVRVQAILPSGAGTYTDWTNVTGAATHWQAVAESPPTADTSYIDDATAGHIDTYAFGDVTPTSGAVRAVVVSAYARKDDAGDRTLALVVRSGATDQVGANANVSTAYAYYQEIVEVDPATAAAWTIAGVNAAEFGVKDVA